MQNLEADSRPNPAPGVAAEEATTRAGAAGFTWGTLLRVATLANVVVLTTIAAMLQDPESAALAVASLLGLWLLRVRGGGLGLILLGLLFLNNAGWMVPGAATNVIYSAGLRELLIPSTVAAISLAGLVAVLGSALTRSNPGAGAQAARLVGVAALGGLALVVAAGLTIGGGQPSTADGAIVLETKHNIFSESELVAQAGEITVVLANNDFFWHTFTIDEIGVDLWVPVGGERAITFTAPPGTYSFYCAVPGHDAIGMRGTLTIR